jgi:hypothetical protein
MGNEGSSGRDSGYSTGYGGTVCTKQDILRAANATNSTSDTSFGPGNQVSGMITAFQGGANYNCVPEHISTHHYVDSNNGGGYVKSGYSSQDLK